MSLCATPLLVQTQTEPGLHEELEKPLDELSAQSTSGTQERSSLPSWWSSLAGLEARRESG